jgi:hypothetical protein
MEEMSGILETLKFLGSSWLEVAVAVDKRLETQAARIAELEAALKDMAKYIWRDDYQKLEPTTRAALGDKK